MEKDNMSYLEVMYGLVTDNQLSIDKFKKDLAFDTEQDSHSLCNGIAEAEIAIGLQKKLGFRPAHDSKCNCLHCDWNRQQEERSNYIVVGCGAPMHPYMKVHSESHGRYRNEECNKDCEKLLSATWDENCVTCRRNKKINDRSFLLFIVGAWSMLLSVLFILFPPLTMVGMYILFAGLFIVALTCIGTWIWPEVCRKTKHQAKVNEMRRRSKDLEEMLGIKDQLAELDKL